MTLRWLLALTLSSSLFLPVTAATAQTLDQYGGYTALPVSGGGTGHWRVAMLGNRWVFVTPLGNAFWLRSVFNVNPARNWNVKYATSTQWAQETPLRMQAWGLNGFHISPNYHALSTSVGGNASVGLPYTYNLWPSYYGLMNSNGGFAGTPPGAFKDIVNNLNGTYKDWRGGSLPDVFDPAFDAYVNWRVQAQLADAGWGPRLRSAWHLGFTTDDADSLYGFGPAPGTTGPDGIAHAHPGWLVLATAPSATSSTKWGVTYSDPKMYSKYQLQSDLQAKYGTIDALNAAWGSAYTTWDSAGGYGVGTGFLDEDGRHTAWLGDTHGMLAGAAPAVVTDLNAFLYHFALQYGTVLRTRIKQGLPNHLVLGPASLNGHFSVSRPQVLQAMGATMDVLNASIGTQNYLNLTVQALGDIPIVTWEGFLANPDSALSAYPNPNYPYIYSTQAARGQGYASKLAFLLTTQSSLGTIPVIGFGLWDWADSLGERANWGLVTLRENAYDGVESVTPIGTDPWGSPTGGEAGNYGNFLSSVVSANARVAAAIGASACGPGSTCIPTSTTVSITSPKSGSTVKQTVTVSAAASGSAVRIDLVLDGSLMGIFSGTVATYAWDTTASPNGTHRWVAKAYDSSGTSVTSSPVDVTVNNLDTTPPLASITQPTDGSSVVPETNTTIQAAASDNVGVARVEFYVNGSLKCSVTIAPYACRWSVPAGSPSAATAVYGLQAKAHDAQGNVGSSSIVTVQAQ